MKLICMACDEQTEHYFVGVNPDTNESLYRCNECGEGTEFDGRGTPWHTIHELADLVAHQ